MIDCPWSTQGQSLWEYNGIIKEAIRRIKFGGEWDIIKELINKKDFEVPGNVVITYVPITKKKERERGFNQSEIIAKKLGEKLNLPIVRLLDKIKETSDQVGLSRYERLKNLKGSFAARPWVDQGQNVLLVDDVYTTGATMEECSRTLKKSGYKNINYFTIARTV